jgi:hypothetical protein
MMKSFFGSSMIRSPFLNVRIIVSPARPKGDRDIEYSMTVLQDNIRVLSRPHLYPLDVERTTNAPLLKLSLECGPVLRTKPVCHTSTSFSISFAAR